MKVHGLFLASLAVGCHASSKDSTITKVVKILQDMLAKSKTEGDEERDLFAKFKCFCDSNEAEKKESISDLGKEINVLSSKIEELQGSTGGLSSECAQLRSDMMANEQARNEAESIRNKANEEYVAEKGDMTAAIGQMKDAIETLSEVGADQTAGSAADHAQFMAKSAFLQNNVRVKSALAAVSAFLNPTQAKMMQSFLQSRAPFTGTYTSQSGQIVGTLKSMKDTFEANKAGAIATEAQQLKAFNELMKTLKKAYQEMSDSYDTKQEGLGDNDGDLSAKKTQLAESKESKANDEEYLEKLLAMCEEKTNDYHERKVLRANEDAAVAEAVAILNSDSAFESFGKTDATSTGSTGPVKFIQLRSRRVRVHASAVPISKQVQQILLQAGSPRVKKIAAMIQAENVFDTVLAEITKMLKVIVEEGKADKENLDWCNSERTENDKNLGTKNSEIETLDGEIEGLINRIDDPQTGLKAQIKATEESLLSSVTSQKTETAERTKENLLYQEDIKNLVAANNILKKAIKVLRKYYDKLAERMEQENGFLQEDPQAPDESKWGNYAGQSSKGGDAIGMLEFILESTIKEETEAHAAEETSQHDYEDSMTSLKDDEANFEKTIADLQEQLASSEEELVNKKKEHKATTKDKEAIEAYLLKIKPGCDFITTNFDEREDNRATETTALKKAQTLIKDTPVYKTAVAKARVEGFGDCTTCEDAEDHVDCKACMAKVTVPGYCAGHQGTPGC